MKTQSLRSLLVAVLVLPACATYRGEREPDTSFARVVSTCSFAQGTFLGEITVRGNRNVEKAVQRRGGHIACEVESGSEEVNTTNAYTTTSGSTTYTTYTTSGSGLFIYWTRYKVYRLSPEQVEREQCLDACPAGYPNECRAACNPPQAPPP